MEPSPEPALPVPLPRPLSDPLRFYRWIVLCALVGSVGADVDLLLPKVQKVREAAARTQPQNNLKQIAHALHPDLPDAPVLPDAAAGTQSRNNLQQTRTLRDTAYLAALAGVFAVLLCTFRLLPRKATNAIYLRSFRNDATTGSLRSAAQAALGQAFRLSGIRDPRRRWPALIRHFLYILFLIRYAQPKFMNLEAGRDWKARLWRSLGQARCALIDASELTPFVREEVELAIGCLGFHRVLFIGADSHTADDWRQVILTALGSPEVAPECIQVALWADTAAGRAAFRDQVRAFADCLPADPPGLNAAAFPETGASSDPGGNAVTGESWRTLLLASLISAALGGMLGWAEKRMPDVGLALLLLGAIYYTLAFLLLLQYIAVCGSLRERLRIGGTFLFAVVVFSSLPVVVHAFVAPVERGTSHTNNLKLIGLARKRDEVEHQHPPPWAAGGTYALLLPYVEHEGLFARFQLDEPWDAITDGRSNTVLYAELSQTRKTEPAGTYYQALTGPGTLWDEYTPAARRSQPYLPAGRWQTGSEVASFDPLFRLRDVRQSGLSIIVGVEAAEPVPWTKLTDLDYRPASGEWLSPDDW